MMPAILAHGGLATTDMAATATVSGAIFALILWLEQPSVKRSIVLGVAVGIAVFDYRVITQDPKVCTCTNFGYLP